MSIVGAGKSWAGRVALAALIPAVAVAGVLGAACPVSDVVATNDGCRGDYYFCTEPGTDPGIPYGTDPMVPYGPNPGSVMSESGTMSAGAV